MARMFSKSFVPPRAILPDREKKTSLPLMARCPRCRAIACCSCSTSHGSARDQGRPRSWSGGKEVMHTRGIDTASRTWESTAGVSLWGSERTCMLLLLTDTCFYRCGQCLTGELRPLHVAQFYIQATSTLRCPRLVTATALRIGGATSPLVIFAARHQTSSASRERPQKSQPRGGVAVFNHQRSRM